MVQNQETKNAPDWKVVEEQLVETGCSAIRRLAGEHPEEVCSFFAFAIDPYSSVFEVCLDTYVHGIHEAMKYERRTFGRRQEGARHPLAWKRAHHWLDSPHLVDYAPSAGSFAFAGYAQGKIEQWEEYIVMDEQYSHGEDEDSYLEGNWRIVIWKAIERLLKMQVFDALHLSSPFRLGYEFHDEDLYVLRLINWPAVDKEK